MKNKRTSAKRKPKSTAKKSKMVKSKKNILPGFSQTKIRRILKAGLPAPTPSLSQTEFAKLQKTWYDKLSAEGFQDIEWVDHKRGTGHDSPHLKGSLILGKQYHPGRQLYFDMACAYLQHCTALKGYYRFIWRLHATGHTYDQIMEQLSKKYSNHPSKFTVFYDIEHLAKKCFKWNARAAEGILRKRNEDKESLLNSPLAELYATEYNWVIGEEEL